METKGTVLSVKKLWWLKINTKPVRTGPFDGAVFPHILKITYTVNGIAYTKRQWLAPGKPVPSEGSTVTVRYCEDNPKKAKILS